MQHYIEYMYLPPGLYNTEVHKLILLFTLIVSSDIVSSALMTISVLLLDKPITVFAM